MRAADAFALVEPTVADALAPAVERIAALVETQAQVTVSPDGLSEWFETFRILQAFSIWSNHGTWIEKTRPKFGPGIKERFEWAAKVDPADVAAAREKHAAIRARIGELLGQGDILCLPTSPRVAPYRNSRLDDIEIRYRHQAMKLLCIAGLGGLPQISLPLAELDGLPLGLSLVGPRGSDLQLLALARELRPAVPGAVPL